MNTDNEGGVDQAVFVHLLHQEARRSLPDMEVIRRLIEGGADLNAMGNHSALGAVFSNLAPMPGKNKLIPLLISRGANPLAPENIFNREILEDKDNSIGKMLEAMVQKENEGAGLRDAEGGNPLHVLAYRNETKTCIFLEMDEQVLRSKRGEQIIHPAWVNQARPGDLATPAHLLWLNLIEKMEMEAHEIIDAQHAWRASRQLHDRGADFMALDSRKETPYALILQCLGRGLALPEDPEERETWDSLQAQCSLSDLQEQTPFTGAKNKAAARL